MSKLDIIKNEQGATAVEYGLLIVLIAISLVSLLGDLGDNYKTVFTNASTALTHNTTD